MGNVIIGSGETLEPQGGFKFEFLEQENHKGYCVLPVKIIGGEDPRLFRISITVDVYANGKHEGQHTESISIAGDKQATLRITVNKKDLAANYTLSCYEIKTEYV